MDPSSRASSSHDLCCPICLNNIQSQPICKEEEKKVLNCSHIFHRECIGAWLKQKHNCPICRAHVDVDTPEATRPEMTLEEILAVPDVNYSIEAESISQNLSSVRETVIEIRRVRRLNLNENTSVAQVARKVDSVAARIFGWRY
jgi:hypothetical protein